MTHIHLLAGILFNLAHSLRRCKKYTNSYYRKIHQWACWKRIPQCCWWYRRGFIRTTRACSSNDGLYSQSVHWTRIRTVVRLDYIFKYSDTY